MAETASSRSDAIKMAFERNARAMALKPALGRGTAVTKVRLRDGLTCDVEDGTWRLTVDMSEKSGGNGRAPDPGVYGRTALGSCLAMGYTFWGAKLGVTFKRLEVEVQADYDSGGYHGVSDAPAGYSQVRYIVTVESDAAEAAIMEVLDQADAHSPYHDNFSRALAVRREVRVVVRSKSLESPATR